MHEEFVRRLSGAQSSIPDGRPIPLFRSGALPVPCGVRGHSTGDASITRASSASVAGSTRSSIRSKASGPP
jgi:hypothetical protein